MYVNIFEYRMRPDADLDAYAKLAERMYAMVSGDERFGFLGLVSYRSSPTEGVVIERFATAEGARLWAEYPEHRVTQRRGREEFYEWYRGSGGEVQREYRHPAAVGHRA